MPRMPRTYTINKFPLCFFNITNAIFLSVNVIMSPFPFLVYVYFTYADCLPCNILSKLRFYYIFAT